MMVSSTLRVETAVWSADEGDYKAREGSAGGLGACREEEGPEGASWAFLVKRSGAPATY